jgi:hypothetical protein
MDKHKKLIAENRTKCFQGIPRNPTVAGLCERIIAIRGTNNQRKVNNGRGVFNSIGSKTSIIRAATIHPNANILVNSNLFGDEPYFCSVMLSIFEFLSVL